jgi:hypothetical protein
MAEMMLKTHTDAYTLSHTLTLIHKQPRIFFLKKVKEIYSKKIFE